MKRLLFFATLALTIVATACQAQKSTLKRIKEHREAIHIKDGWIRDPYIILGADDKYYLTGTTPNPNDPREQSDRYNIGLGPESIVGYHLRVWRSDDLVEWEELESPYTLIDTFEARKAVGINTGGETKRPLWAPELHWLGDRWAAIHCPKGHSALALSKGRDVAAPWTFADVKTFNGRHDPSLFIDDDGTRYLLYGNTLIAPIKDDFSALAKEPVRIDPSDRRIGHEGATLRKIEGRYVHFGTAWSTDKGRKGSYNLYYCTSDTPMGEYDERKFVGRFLGHGTPFQDRDGRWWCTAFFNANVPPLDSEGIEERDLSETAQTINQLGTTIVPLEVYTDKRSGELIIRAKDPRYRNPGPDEVQKFNKM